MSSFSGHTYELLFDQPSGSRRSPICLENSSDSDFEKKITAPKKKAKNKPRKNALQTLTNKPRAINIKEETAICYDDFTSESDAENTNSPTKNKAKASKKRASNAFKYSTKIPSQSLLNGDLFDEQFIAIFMEAKTSLKKLMEIGGDKEQLKRIDWASEIEVGSSCYLEFRELFRPLFLRSEDDVVYVNYKKIFHSDLNSLISACDRVTEFNDKEKKVALKMLVQEVFNSGVCAKKTLDGNQVHSEEEECTIFYVAGFVINKLLKENSSNESKKIGEVMREKNPESIPQEYKKWIEKQSRGGLKYPNIEAFSFFKKIDSHTHYLFDPTCQDKVQKVVSSVNEDLEIQEKWHKIIQRADVSAAEGGKVFKVIKSTFINTKGNGLTKKVRNEKKDEARKKRLKTKFESREKMKNKIESEVKQQILATHNIIV